MFLDRCYYPCMVVLSRLYYTVQIVERHSKTHHEWLSRCALPVQRVREGILLTRKVAPEEDTAVASFRRLIAEPIFLRRYRRLHPRLFLCFAYDGSKWLPARRSAQPQRSCRTRPCQRRRLFLRIQHAWKAIHDVFCCVSALSFSETGPLLLRCYCLSYNRRVWFTIW